MTGKTMKRELAILISCICCTIQIIAKDHKEPENKKSTTTIYPDNGIFTNAEDANLLLNPGFENRTSKWTLGKLNGGAGLFTIDTVQAISGTQSALVVTTNQEQNYQDLQLFTFFQLTNLTNYSISFQADVKTACLISISFGNGFETFFEEKFLLRPDTKAYGPFTFKSEVNDPFSYFAFNLGRTKTKIRFDDVEIQADYTEKEFNNVLAKSGINVHYTNTRDNNSIFISAPTISSSDLPIILYNKNNNVIFADKLRKGQNEANITINKKLKAGNYYLKVFAPAKPELFHFSIK